MNEHRESSSVPSFGEVSAPMVLASQGQRFGTFLLDLIFYVIFILIVAYFMDFIGGFGPKFQKFTRDMVDQIDKQNRMNIVLLLFYFIYYVPQEALSGRTLGKLITGTKAVKEDGTELSFGQALGRTLCRLIPFEAFSFIWYAGRPRGWHDKIPKTKVISVRRTS